MAGSVPFPGNVQANPLTLRSTEIPAGAQRGFLNCGSTWSLPGSANGLGRLAPSERILCPRDDRVSLHLPYATTLESPLKKSLALVAALALVSSVSALDIGGAVKSAKAAAVKTVDTAAAATKEAARAEVQSTTNAVLGAPAADTAKPAAPAPVVAAPAAPAVDSAKVEKKEVKAEKKATKKAAKTEKKAAKAESKDAKKAEAKPAAKPAAK